MPRHPPLPPPPLPQPRLQQLPLLPPGHQWLEPPHRQSMQPPQLPPPPPPPPLLQATPPSVGREPVAEGGAASAGRDLFDVMYASDDEHGEEVDDDGDRQEEVARADPPGADGELQRLHAMEVPGAALPAHAMEAAWTPAAPVDPSGPPFEALAQQQQQQQSHPACSVRSPLQPLPVPPCSMPLPGGTADSNVTIEDPPLLSNGTCFGSQCLSLPPLASIQAAGPAGGGTPVGGTPVGGTPIGGTLVGGTPIGGTPIGGTPIGGTPIGGTPIGGTPAAMPPRQSFGSPVYALTAASAEAASAEAVSAARAPDATAYLLVDRALGRDGCDLGQQVVSAYKESGVRALYPWQHECLTRPGVLRGQHLVYCTPTSGGKSLVAEVLLCRALRQGRKAMLVVPFVALVEEATERLKRLFGGLPTTGRRKRFFPGKNGLLRIEASHGGRGRGCFDDDVDLLVCTFERANGILNRQLDTPEGLGVLGALVIDEVHMLSDPSRGFLIEQILTKVLAQRLKCSSSHHVLAARAPPGAVAGSQGPGGASSARVGGDAGGGGNASARRGGGPQIVCMSATLGNPQRLQAWLGAVLYVSDYRPVPLHQYVVAPLPPPKERQPPPSKASAGAVRRVQTARRPRRHWRRMRCGGIRGRRGHSKWAPAAVARGVTVVRGAAVTTRPVATRPVAPPEAAWWPRQLRLAFRQVAS